MVQQRGGRAKFIPKSERRYDLRFPFVCCGVYTPSVVLSCIPIRGEPIQQKETGVGTACFGQVRLLMHAASVAVAGAV